MEKGSDDADPRKTWDHLPTNKTICDCMCLSRFKAEEVLPLSQFTLIWNQSIEGEGHSVLVQNDLDSRPSRTHVTAPQPSSGSLLHNFSASSSVASNSLTIKALSNWYGASGSDGFGTHEVPFVTVPCKRRFRSA